MNNNLLITDAVINLALGALLLAYPRWLVKSLGLPNLDSPFYPSILGGVLVGIGLALLIAAKGGEHGLGLDGAIAINLCGGGVLAGWLVTVPGMFSPSGKAVLWSVAVLVVGVGLAELRHRRGR